MKTNHLIIILVWISVAIWFRIDNSQNAIGQDVPGVSAVKITGGDESNTADVTDINGKKQLETFSDLNTDFHPDSWCELTATGSIGDTITVNIPDDSCSVTTTITATEAGDLEATVALMVLDFNADVTCKILYQSSKVTDNPIIVVASNKIGKGAERPDPGDFDCTSTGSAAISVEFDNLVSRQKRIRCVPDADDPRECATDISGIITTKDSTVGNRVVEFLEDSGGSSDMVVDGSVMPVEFIFGPDPDDEIFVSQIRCFGSANNIKFGQFFGLNSPLTNGVLIEIRSNANTVMLRAFKTTEDFKNLFAFPSATEFKIDLQAGLDGFIAVLITDNPFPIDAVGTNAPAADDFVRLTVRDNLTNALIAMECLLVGFKR